MGDESIRSYRDGEPPSARVVHAVADAEGVSPMDLPPLTDAVDPDSLDSIVESFSPAAGNDRERVEFEYVGYMVTVDATGAVSVSAAVGGT